MNDAWLALAVADRPDERHIDACRALHVWNGRHWRGGGKVAR